MNPQIRKLADKCFADRRANKLPTHTFMALDSELEEFYCIAYNAGLEAAAKWAEKYIEDFDGSDCAKGIRSMQL